MSASNKTAASTVKNEANTATEKSDRLLSFQQVHALIGSACKTGHTARKLAAEGKIRAVRLNERVIRYSERSVMALIEGRAS